MNETITIVPAHANSEQKKKLLKTGLKAIKTPKIVTTNCPVDDETYELCDYVIYDKRNPRLMASDYSIYGVDYWFQITTVDENGNFSNRIQKQCEFDHGFAAYTLIANGIKCAKAMGFKNCNIIEYDYEWDDEVMISHENELKNNDAVFYRYTPSEWGGEAYNSSFFSGKSDALLHFFGKYNELDSYYRNNLPTPGAKLFERVLYYGMQGSEYSIKEFSTDYIKKKLKYDQSKRV